MDELEAKFLLLQQEMDAIQQGIRACSAGLFQIKGWCVTVATLTAGAAVNTGQGRFLLVGVAASIAFWLVDAHFKALQRVFIKRDNHIEQVLSQKPVLVALESGDLATPRLASAFPAAFPPGAGPVRRLLWELRMLCAEARLPISYNVYAFVVLCLLIAIPFIPEGRP